MVFGRGKGKGRIEKVLDGLSIFSDVGTRAVVDKTEKLALNSFILSLKKKKKTVSFWIGLPALCVPSENRVLLTLG